jgi:uncharacterized protein (DUF736 family)
MEQKDNSGAIFKHDKKDNEKAPDYSGKIVVDGVEKRIALWLNTSKDGSKKYFSVKISESQQQTNAPAEKPAPAKVVKNNSLDWLE